MKRGIKLTSTPQGRMTESARISARDGVRAAMARHAGPTSTTPKRHAIRHAIPKLLSIADQVRLHAKYGPLPQEGGFDAFPAQDEEIRAVVADLRNALDDEPGSSVSVDLHGSGGTGPHPEGSEGLRSESGGVSGETGGAACPALALGVPCSLAAGHAGFHIARLAAIPDGEAFIVQPEETP